MVAKFLGSLFGNGAVHQSVVEQQPMADPVRDELSATAAALEELRGRTLGGGAQLPTLVLSQVLQLIDVLRALIGYIGQSGASTEQRVLLDAVITDYLPSPLRAYARMTADARADDSANTAALLEQLETLYSTVQNLDNQVRTGAITELAVHGQFLKDKFDIEGLHLEGR